MNFFIEGLQGSGKSTLLRFLLKEDPEYRGFYEGDLSPLVPAWCAYLREDDYQAVLDITFFIWKRKIFMKVLKIFEKTDSFCKSGFSAE